MHGEMSERDRKEMAEKMESKIKNQFHELDDNDDDIHALKEVNKKKAAHRCQKEKVYRLHFLRRLEEDNLHPEVLEEQN